MFSVKLFVVLVFFVRNALAYIEYVEVGSCETCTLMLTCRHLNSVIAVFNATFEPFSHNSTYFEDLKGVVPPVFPRFALNRRCSGVNHCSFILTKDCPGADRWGPGYFTVRFACVAEKRVAKYCNDNITLPYPEVNGVSEGFIRNPGYPRFYLGQQNCTWRIQAPRMQRIKVTILDLSLIGADNPERCLDIFEIKESETTVFASCVEKEPPKEIVSLGDAVEITLKASESLIARRGILLHYTAIGCLTPRAPSDGYLVYRNDTDALFNCCVGYAFPGTFTRSMNLKCLGHVWNIPTPLPDCIITDQTKKSDLSTRELKPHRNNMTESLSEVVVPSIIIIALFVINSIILFVIYKYKKRKTALYTEEELGTIPIQSNGGNSA